MEGFTCFHKSLCTLNKVYFPLIFLLRRTTAASVTSPSPGNNGSSHSPSSSESIRTNCNNKQKEYFQSEEGSLKGERVPFREGPMMWVAVKRGGWKETFQIEEMWYTIAV